MRVLFLDAATRTGWAVVEGDARTQQLVNYGAVDATAEGLKAIVDGLHIEFLNDRGPELCVVEEPFLDKNVRSLKVLAYTVGRWLQELERSGFRTSLVTADTWQLGLLTGLITPASPRKDRKAAAKRMVRILYGGLECSEDEADAICGATWAVRQGSVLLKAHPTEPVALAGLGSGRRGFRRRRAG